LQRDRKSVKEIHAGYECGFTCEGFNDWLEGDTVLCFVQVKSEEK
jgi:translation initiation factor IF-2